MPIKRPNFRYSVLLCLFAITAVYEFLYVRDILRGASLDIPFFVIDAASNRIGYVSNQAARAGLLTGEELLKVNGVPYTGSAVLGDAQDHAQVGGNLILTVRFPNERSVKTIALPVTRGDLSFTDITDDLVLQFLLPVSSLLLGFWVAFVRPRDPMAWLLLAVMMSFPNIFETFEIPGWGPGWREVGMFYHAALDGLFPIAIFLFGRYFPEPFPKRSVHDWIWKFQQWLLAVPFGILAGENVIVRVRELDSYESARHIDLFFRPFDHIADILGYLLVGSFFAALAIKGALTRAPDARRRLRLLYWGATMAFTPGLFLTLYARIAQKSMAAAFPQSVIIAALVPLVLFPLTLAYVIVVQKAMPVRVVLRQSLQYGLAKNGIRVLQALLISVAIITAVTLAGEANRNRPQKIAVVSLGIVAALMVRRLGDRLRPWVDKRFFREAYDADHVLAELSEQVRTMVEPKSLLATVATRISETLHVPQIAVLLDGGGLYQPAYAVGYSDLSGLAFPSNTGTVKLLRGQKEPARVHLNNRDSWLYVEGEVSEEERSRLARLQSELLLPLAVREKLLGFIALGPKRSEEPYTGTDVRLLKSVAAQTGLALENANLMLEIASEVAQRERLNREVEIAREVQERLFPQKLPVIAGLDYAGHCRPALGVGGDYYDFLALAQGSLGVAIGDVSGKGIAAALMMASLQASLRGEATRAPQNLAAAIANVNHLVYEASAENRYATFFYGQYDPATGKFDYVNAGHNPPMLFQSAAGQSTVIRLDVGGTVVGLLETFPYQQGSVSLAPGDLLVAYTDGISEAMNAADEEWGEERLMQTIQRCDGLDAGEILKRIFAAADGFVAGAAQHDDMTLVVLRVA